MMDLGWWLDPWLTLSQPTRSSCSSANSELTNLSYIYVWSKRWWFLAGSPFHGGWWQRAPALFLVSLQHLLLSLLEEAPMLILEEDGWSASNGQGQSPEYWCQDRGDRWVHSSSTFIMVRGHLPQHLHRGSSLPWGTCPREEPPCSLIQWLGH